MRRQLVVAILAAVTATGCMSGKTARFGKDLEFLKMFADPVVLSDESGKAQVIVVPQFQGRVMTSTADGARGLSYGWINEGLIVKEKLVPHMNAFGGEDRFWIGPEAGQYGIFFKKGDPFEFEQWQTPPAIDSDRYKLVYHAGDRASMTHRATLTNHSGAEFDVGIEREVRLIGADEAGRMLGVKVPAKVKMVGYQSTNKIVNKGKEAWTKETGLLSIWILGMYRPSPSTTVVVPFNTGPESQLGRIVNDNYFGKVPAERLIVNKDGGVLYFSADGGKRSKIGLTPKRAKPIAGSYDADNRVLTVVHYTLHMGVTDYVNSMWEHQEEPYAGDVLNSYNDGPLDDGSILGPFYELETSSPAAALSPGKSMTHVHSTFHFQGSEKVLDPIARKTLGVSLKDIKTAIKR
jgi:hypothetical protein